MDGRPHVHKLPLFTVVTSAFNKLSYEQGSMYYRGRRPHLLDGVDGNAELHVSLQRIADALMTASCAPFAKTLQIATLGSWYSGSRCAIAIVLPFI